MGDMAPPPNLHAATRYIIERLGREPPLKRIAMAARMLDQLQDLQSQFAAQRRAAVRELRAEGRTLAAIAQLTDMSPSRIKQIEEGTTPTRTWNSEERKQRKADAAAAAEAALAVHDADVRRQALKDHGMWIDSPT